MDLGPISWIMKDHYNICPGTVVQEAIVQAGAIVALMLAGPGLLTIVVAAEVKWRGQVRAGDQPVIQAEIDKRNGAPTRGRGKGVVVVNGGLVCEGTFDYVLKKGRGREADSSANRCPGSDAC